MVRLLRRLPALHEVECLLGRASLVDDRADPADHADRVRGLPDVASHVDAAGAFLDRFVGELEGIQLRLQLWAARDDERHRARFDDLGKVLAEIRLDEMGAELRRDSTGEAEVASVALLEFLPTAVTARTGMPTSSPSSTSFPRFTRESCSWAAPTKIERATADAFSRTASFIEVVTFSLDRSSFRTLAPPLTRRTMGTSSPASIEGRTTPRVTMTASAKGRSGSNVFRGISSLWVGPRKYPWSAASITVWPSDGRMIRAC